MNSLKQMTSYRYVSFMTNNMSLVSEEEWQVGMDCYTEGVIDNLSKNITEG